MLNGGRVFARGLQELDELLQSPQESLMQPLAFRQYPLVVAAGQECAPVQGHSLLEGGSGDGLIR